MEEILRAVAKGIFIQQSVNVGAKLINSKRVTKHEEHGFWLSLLLLGLANLPTQPSSAGTLARR